MALVTPSVHHIAMCGVVRASRKEVKDLRCRSCAEEMWAEGVCVDYTRKAEGRRWIFESSTDFVTTVSDEEKTHFNVYRGISEFSSKCSSYKFPSI